MRARSRHQPEPLAAPVPPRFLPRAGPPAPGRRGRSVRRIRDRDLPAMRGYLAAERAYDDRWLESVRGLRDELTGELAARVIPADHSVSWRRGGHSDFTRTGPH